MNDNPYASPAEIDEPAIAIDPSPRQSYIQRFGKALLRWTVLCAISAAPSFYFAFDLHPESKNLAAIIAGIAVFIVGYAVIECADWFARFQQLSYVKTSLRIGYGTRIALSVIYPLGLGVDMVVGIISTGLTEEVTGQQLLLLHAHNASRALSLAYTFCVFLHTLVQGALLNVLLLGYVVIVYGICRLTAPRPSRRAMQRHSPNFS